MSPTIPKNQSVVLLPTKHAAFEVVHDAEVSRPAPGQMLVKTMAIGLNPVDWMIQRYHFFVPSYPAILGCDAAGEVVALGDGVNNFVIGDRVLFQGDFNNELATFKQYALTIANVTAKIPPNISYDQAASIPLTLATAALGLYAPKPLGSGLVPAWEEAGKNKYANQPFLVVGGASSVGQFAIQLAKLSGFSPIIVTASLKHTEFLESLGATHVIDRNAPLSQLGSSVQEITSLPIEYAYDSISNPDTQQAVYDILAVDGQMVTVLQKDIKGSDSTSSKGVHAVYGVVHGEMHKDKPYTLGLYASLTGMLERGEIKPNRVRVLPDGLKSIIGGLKELEAGSVSGVKLIVHPNN